MKFKLSALTLTLIIFSVSAFARPLADSIGVENHNGKQVILHKLDPKDNYYSIGRRYHVSPKLIIAYNNNANLIIGNVIKVPTDRPFVEPGQKTAKVQPPVQQNKPSEEVNKPAEQPGQQTHIKADASETQYKVSAGETLYSIAKRFNSSVEDIMQTNGLKSNTIAPGEILLIHANSGPGAATATQTVQQVTRPGDEIVAKRDSPAPATALDSNSAANHINPNKYGLFEKDEQGVATWIDDPGLDPNKKLVLHRTAPIGTVIKITNIMTNRTTYAKVVGRFTDNEQTKDVIIVMTKNVAEALGALDKRFQVTLSYGVPNEQ
ncbi:MAG TPA: LysM peptidoglycan-binding domain-containing protein [Mucilaginibacter sp.]|nr:LysM peptidoglycan-binding domain-containing protein [Mucilaginibacter sp.]